MSPRFPPPHLPTQPKQRMRQHPLMQQLQTVHMNHRRGGVRTRMQGKVGSGWVGAGEGAGGGAGGGAARLRLLPPLTEC